MRYGGRGGRFAGIDTENIGKGNMLEGSRDIWRVVGEILPLQKYNEKPKNKKQKQMKNKKDKDKRKTTYCLLFAVVFL